MSRFNNEQGNWTPANGGTETPYIARNGRKVLYVCQLSTGKHAYLDCLTDIMLSELEEMDLWQDVRPVESALGLLQGKD